MIKLIIPRQVLSVLMLFGMASFLIAQNGAVSDRVTDADMGDPLVDANVLVVGTNLGATTDVNDVYSISSVPAADQRFNANYIGCASS